MSNSVVVDLNYWLRWQVPVCGLIIVIPVVKALQIIKKVKTEPPMNHNDLWVPCWRNLNPIWLFLYRAFAFVCLSFIFYQTLALDGLFAFYFYTQWTFTLVIVYFGLGTLISAHGCWVYSNKPSSENGERGEFLKKDLEESSRSRATGTFRAQDYRAIKLQSHCAQEEFQQRAAFWGYVMLIIYQTCAGAVILTDIVFWCVLVPFLSNAHFRLNLLMGCMHSLNVFFIILDTSLNSLPFPWFRLSYFVLWSCLYIGFQWIMHACGFSWWPYPFLELSTAWAPLWYFGLAVVHIPCYGFFALLMKAKVSIFSRLFPHAFVSCQ